jgi:tetratricopeptide (TPR) repeat protein
VPRDRAAHAVAAIDPAAVHTLAELADALNRLRAGRSYADLDREVNPAQVQPRILPAATLSDLVNGKSVPTRETVITFLRACGLREDPEQAAWLAALERVSNGHLRRPPGSIRVREARPRLLGVHAAIQVAGADSELPPYVPRDVDEALRAAIGAAAGHGGFVLLIGESSVGKTRTLHEAVKAALPEWWLLHPADAETIETFAAAPTPRTVLWLDELQTYLDQPGGVPTWTVRTLINAGVVIVATLWPNQYYADVAPRELNRSGRGNVPELSRLANVFAVPEVLSREERRRGEALAGDGRIRIALDTMDAGFTQVLAAGPELVRRWEHAPDPFGKALITAALDARRIGVSRPLDRPLLEAAAAGYLHPTQQATAPIDWFERALAYASEPLHGAASALSPVPAGIGRIAGYTTADYLYQHALRVRRTIHAPGALWQALVDQNHPEEAFDLGRSAHHRGRPEVARELYTLAAQAGDPRAAHLLIDLLAERGEVDAALAVIVQHTGPGDGYAADRMIDLLAAKGDVANLRERAESGDGYAAGQLAAVLADQGQVDEAIAVLRQPAETGDGYVAERLAALLAAHGRLDELRHRDAAGDRHAAYHLVEAAVANLDLPQLRQRADRGDPIAAARLADMLVARDEVAEALTVLRPHDDRNDPAIAERLAVCLARQGRLDELQSRAQLGDEPATYQLALTLAERGDVLQALTLLRRRADDSDMTATSQQQLAEVLARYGPVEELRQRADGPDGWYFAERFADLLAERGDEAQLRRRSDAGDWHAGPRLADLLEKDGRIDESIAVLRQHADVDYRAAGHLTDLLARHHRVDELDAEVAAGTYGAAERLSTLTSRPATRS